MRCPVCRQDKPTLASGVVDGVYKSSRCDACLNMVRRRPVKEAMEYDRNRQRKQFRKDIIQAMINGKPNADFLKAYPDKAKERFTPEEIRKMERGIK